MDSILIIMKCYVYILKSVKDGRYYIGQTQNLRKRLRRHNQGMVKSTRQRRPLKIKYFEIYPNRKLAYKREQMLKRMKGGIQFKQIIGGIV